MIKGFNGSRGVAVLQKINIILLLFLIISANGCVKKNEPCLSQTIEKLSEPIIPKTTKQPELINSFTPERVVHLSEIATALEKYKLANRSYPISRNSGKEWNAFISSDLSVDPNWIPNLAPMYINELPRDPRKNNIHDNQYLYKSNGAHYKLIAVRPDDCKLVMLRSPEMIDPRRTCKAYGFWTEGAIRW